MAMAKTHEAKIRVNASSSSAPPVHLGTNGKNAMLGYGAKGRK